MTNYDDIQERLQEVTYKNLEYILLYGNSFKKIKATNRYIFLNEGCIEDCFVLPEETKHEG